MLRFTVTFVSVSLVLNFFVYRPVICVLKDCIFMTTVEYPFNCARELDNKDDFSICGYFA